eukprot:3519093-Lingulodinium_polyedra.AAC.1
MPAKPVQFNQLNCRAAEDYIQPRMEVSKTAGSSRKICELQARALCHSVASCNTAVQAGHQCASRREGC